ncbi:BAG domain-containing protein Samui-like [Macrobrachium rosenbergii]|uniref:BAG domain-containing protein Samui-like n=1 Tax=Macrobrachium rosenbergii TaxID=79674 RepID=UPI0034D549BF
MNAKILFVLGLAAIVAADKRPAPPSTSYGLPQVAAAPRPSRPSTSFGVTQGQRPSFDSFENSFERSSFERPSFSRSFDRSFEHSFERSFERNSDESFESPKYNFQFGVHEDSASFEHQEARDDDETQDPTSSSFPTVVARPSGTSSTEAQATSLMSPTREKPGTLTPPPHSSPGSSQPQDPLTQPPEPNAQEPRGQDPLSQASIPGNLANSSLPPAHPMVFLSKWTQVEFYLPFIEMTWI